MNYRIFILIFLCLFLFSCEKSNITKLNKKAFHPENKYKNSGFALVYNDKIEKIKPLEPRYNWL